MHCHSHAMRATLAVVVVMACTKAPVTDAPKPLENKVSLEPMPRVTDAKLALEPSRVRDPEAFIFVDASGGLAFANTGKDWKGAIPTKRRPIPTAEISKLELFVRTALAEDSGVKLDPPTGALDDPPPPEEEDKPDDGVEESGTAMALEEGKMGKKDSDRAEGQYKMQKEHSDPEFARRQAIEQARRAGIIGPSAVGGSGARQPSVRGVPAEMMMSAPLIVAAPTAPASRVVEVLRGAKKGFLAVESNGKLAVLAAGFHYDEFSSSSAIKADWIEIHLDGQGAHVIHEGKQTAVAGWKAGALDRDALLAAVKPLRSPERPVDVLVAPTGVTAQHLVDAIAAFGDPNDTMVSLGVLQTDSAERVATIAKYREQQAKLPVVSIGAPNSQGDLDKAIIRRYIKRNLPKIQNCYEKELEKKPKLQGTVQVQFFIKPDGIVGSSSATGVDPTVATCVADVIRAIEFPKPRGGGGVQVNYPFSFRPADAP
jgi:hypothetical protein